MKKQKTSVLNFLLNLKLSTQFMVLGSILIVGIFAANYWNGLQTNKLAINGALYNQIKDHKDFIADIVPPPAYALEAWQVVLEM